jgi:VIT1/CCC1 family predicted Fe2+/Mn2+ transporter
MKNTNHSNVAKKLMLAFQQDEVNSAAIYSHFAHCNKDAKNCRILNQIAQDEAHHATVWKNYTGKDVHPNMFKVWWYRILTYILGYTFVIKLLELHEYEGIKGLEQLQKEVPEVEQIIADEKKHEKQLIDMLDEERLNYIGAMVLGLNDALVELTGTIAGLTFVLMNTTLIAMAGIITGIAATLSMAASNYLAERADGNPNALKASFYTGIAYLVTVIFLVLPYLIFPNHMFLCALVCMIAIVVFLVFIFNFYIATVKTEPFWPKFLEMAAISLSVALISFLIGLVAKMAFGIEV